MTKPLKRIAVTGGAGQIGYALLFRLANGELFGPDQPIALHILEIPAGLKALDGVRMELEDCAFPLLKEIHTGSDPFKIFKNVDLAILVGAKPRGPGMERADLLKDNGKIFIEQGKALNEVANSDVKVFVVGNPCNTNCLIAMKNAPKIPKKNFFAMTRLDQNRAVSHIAREAKVDMNDVKGMTIWGNHSSTMVPDASQVYIKGKPLEHYIRDKKWLENDFIINVQKRGSAVIEARGSSSAASAANAIIGSIRDLIGPTQANEWYSVARISDGNPYGIVDDLIFSFPCVSEAPFQATIVPQLQLNDFTKAKIKETEKELLEEKKLVQELITR